MADTVAIASEIQQIHADYYGHSPGAVSVYEADDVLVVLIEETFTRAEQLLIARGEALEVQAIRRRFQMTIADQFKEIVQAATGRVVRSFLSDTDLHEQLAVETFVLGNAVEDMDAFEREGARVDGEQELSDQGAREGSFRRHED